MNHSKYKIRLKSTFFKVLVFAMASILPAIPAHASNEAGPYFTLTGSIDTFDDMKLTNVDSSLSTSYLVKGTEVGQDRGLGFNHSVGYRFKNSFSTELEFSYKGGQFESDSGLDGDMTTKSFLVNGMYSFDIRKFYTPYVGYGIGLAFHEATLDGKGDEGNTTLAYQLKVGVDMKFSRKLSLLLGYRYFTTNNPDFHGFFTAESSSHGIEAGVKFHFLN